MNATLSYRESEVRGASPMQLVILLYEQTLRDLRRALAALARGDVEARTREINHALLVIGHLQGSLDKRQGGRVAVNLEKFYNQLRTGLVDAQCTQSTAGLELQIERLTRVHSAWRQAEQSLTAPAREADRNARLEELSLPQPQSERSRAVWKA
jgi:flagellar secretion chaperone FliS